MTRKILTAILALSLTSTALSGCGFKPLHSQSILGEDTKLSDIKIISSSLDKITGHEAGFYVTQRLEDRIGTDGERYTLTLLTGYSRYRSGVTGLDVAGRYNVTIGSNYFLTDNKTGVVLTTGRVQARTTFGSGNGPYGIISADTNGMQQASKEAADLVILDIARYFGGSRELTEEQKVQNKLFAEAYRKTLDKQGQVNEDGTLRIEEDDATSDLANEAANPSHANEDGVLLLPGN